MAPPTKSVDLKAAKKGNKSNSKHEKATGARAGDVKRGDEKMMRAMEDERFAPARMDPRFRPMQRKDAKVGLDSRFNRILTDPMFASSEAPVDKRGRRRKKGARENPMLHCYLNQKEKERKEREEMIREEEDDELEEGDEQDEEESSSSDDEEEDDQYSVGSDIAHYLMARHDGTPMIYKETDRLAIVNMDWDHIKVGELYQSIYPSEFGLKCMNIETTRGPSALVGDDDNDVDGEENSEHDSETENNKLRAYELNRPRYYSAVVVCDSSATANQLYTILGGTEFLKTANVFDLRFIPDSVEFKHPARDVATEAPPRYNAPVFETRALQHSEVKPIWDEDEPGRKRILRRKFTDDQFEDLAAYLGSDDSASDNELDDSGDESLPNGVAKRKLTNEKWLALLQPGDKSEGKFADDQDMEITFNMELEDLSKRILERKSTEMKNVWEMHQEKMKEKQKARKRWSKDDNDYGDEDSADEKDDFVDDEKSDKEAKPIKKQKVKARAKGKGKGNDNLPEEHFEPEASRGELELLVATDQDVANGAKGYNIKRKSKKGKDSVKEKLPEIDLSKDPRFEDMFTSHLYALDPTNPQYKRSATFMRKQAGKKGVHVGTLDNEPPVEESSLGSTLPPNDASAKNANQKRDGASTEKLQMLSAIKSLKRNLAVLKQGSRSDR